MTVMIKAYFLLRMIAMDNEQFHLEPIERILIRMNYEERKNFDEFYKIHWLIRKARKDNNA
ncbi:hypothetical protein UFOVP97_2 [uncultured Caudovirales phage]|uniref:Uncharacterized protein n=1 Tax=uncultured Caudovirales phage TaxID=2100421 RepID=A0A6J5LIZ1_9CAUD|nr:hypothetical protein UFOVP97_2 [uncultured Caudovirales phage]CAB4134131.1 hypothetical protein UFOVP268_20 [uncultured Caudovirales phage]